MLGMTLLQKRVHEIEKRYLNKKITESIRENIEKELMDAVKVCMPNDIMFFSVVIDHNRISLNYNVPWESQSISLKYADAMGISITEKL